MNQVFSDRNQMPQSSQEQQPQMVQRSLRQQTSQMMESVQGQNGPGQNFQGQPGRNVQGQSFKGQSGQNIPGRNFQGQSGQNIPGQNFQRQPGQNIPGQNFQGQSGQNIPGQNLQGQSGQNVPGQNLQKQQGQQVTSYGQNQQSQNQRPVETQRNQSQQNFQTTAGNAVQKNGAGFWIRLAAYVIDSMIIGVVLMMINVPVWFMELSMGDHAIFTNILFEFNAFDILNYLLVTGYFIGMTYSTERTVGKMLMKIRVKSEVSEKMTFGQVVFRETVGKYLSGIFYIGYIMIGISDKKKGLHDQLADTKVVYEIN